MKYYNEKIEEMRNDLKDKCIQQIANEIEKEEVDKDRILKFCKVLDILE